MNLNSNVRNTENSKSHRYCQREMLSLLHQSPFEYVTLKHKQVGDYNSLLTLVLLQVWLLLKSFLEICLVVCFFSLHKYNKIQYVAVAQNINTILYDCSVSNLQINMLTAYLIMNVNFNKMLETLIFQRFYFILFACGIASDF